MYVSFYLVTQAIFLLMWGAAMKHLRRSYHERTGFFASAINRHEHQETVGSAIAILIISFIPFLREALTIIGSIVLGIGGLYEYLISWWHYHDRS